MSNLNVQKPSTEVIKPMRSNEEKSKTQKPSLGSHLRGVENDSMTQPSINQFQKEMMTSTIYKGFLFTKFCSSAAENLDLRLAKHEQASLANECSHIESCLLPFGSTSLKNVIFIRFCIRLGIIVDLGLSPKQLICLYKECIKIAQYYDDVIAMQEAILLFVLLLKNVWGYEKKIECEEVIVYGKKCIDIGKTMGSKHIERDACYVVGKTCVCIKQYQEAVLYCKKSLDMAKETCNIIAVMYASLMLGKAYVGLHQYEDAIVYNKNCFVVAKETGEKEVEMHALLEVGKAYAGLQQYEDAIAYWKNCIEITKETGEKEVEMHAHLEVGRAYEGLASYQNGIKSFEKCIAIAINTGDRTIEMYGYFELGKAYEKLLQYDDANVYYKRCIQMAKNSDQSMEMKAYSCLVMTYAQLKLHNDAIWYGRKCIEIAKYTGDKMTEQHAYINLVEIYADLKQYEEAISCSKKCVDIAKEIGRQNIEKDAYLLVAVMLLTAKKYEESIAYSIRGLKISEEIYDFDYEMMSCYYLGIAYTQIRRNENASFFFKRCLKIAKKIGKKTIEMKAHLSLSQIFMSLPILNQALLHLNEGKNIAQELNNDEHTAKFRDLQHMFNIIVGYYNQIPPNEQIIGELIDIPNGPEQDLLDAIDEAVNAKDVWTKTVALLKHHCFCYSKKQYKKALASLKHLKKIVEDTDTKLWCNLPIVNLYMLMSQDDQALAYCWEILTEVKESGYIIHQSLFYSTMGELLYRDGQWSASEKYLREALKYFEIVFASLGSNDDPKISIIDKYCNCYKRLSIVLNRANHVEEALEVSDRCRARALKDLLFSNFGMNEEGLKEEQKDCHDIQAFLASSNGFTVLFYSLFCNGILLFFTDANEIAYKGYFYPFEMNEKIPDFMNLLDHAFDELDARKVDKCEDRSLDAKQENTGRRGEKEESIYASCTDVFFGIDDAQNVTNPDSRQERSGDFTINGNALKYLYNSLIGPVKDFVDQDEIVIIPDGVLNCVPFAALRDPDTGKYLSETKRIRLAPSISTLKVLQERPADQHHRRGALIIGNPLVGKVMMNGEVMEIQHLFGALDEAIDIALILGVRPLLAAQATKPAVLERLKQGVSVVHIAAHGMLSKATIVLAPPPEVRATKIPDEEDYMLTMSDVQQAQVRAQLVVLSCCHSGRGEIRAEGVVGMCRAFLASGARAVVASLWAIDDEATLEFMKTFYKHLKEGNSASRSLQMTMNDMRQTKRFSAPKYWAPFFLIGDDVTIDFTDREIGH